MRHIDHLLVVVGRRAGIIRECANGRRRSRQPQPIRRFAFRIQLDAVMRLAAIGDKIQSGVRIEKRSTHMKERSGQQNSLGQLIFGANLSLPRKKRRQVVSTGPPWSLRSEREQHPVVAVKSQVLYRIEGNCILRQPDRLIREIRISRLSCAGIIMIAHRIEPPAREQLDAARNVNAILHHSCRLVIVFIQNARAGVLNRIL